MPHTLDETLRWFTLAVPNPTGLNLSVQLGVHFEEVAEMLEVINCVDQETERFLENAQHALEVLATHLKTQRPELLISDPIGFLDSVGDQLVTATGSAYMLGMDPVGALDEINDSNFSKFGEDGLPVFDANNKIQKGPKYRKPDLSRFV